ncbi:MAG: bifunctional acetate--CoA ligase family protein/GNAT family N-acetyltransferase [Ideonella sp.]|nr:bifunctional acetate--CoA ligase family protein/GNAT family N-acetyltransferase [Ideonella sp.]MCC7455442.1 bifunctional acetate--CoA ligase family protein/GNAT family N-acetyltransferase [Nitrospira sp.]
MSVRNLDRLFQPRSLAVIGASDRARSIGALVMANLLAARFDGPLWPVNIAHDTVAGQPAFHDVAALPGVPDLAVVCTPAPTVPGLIAALGARGTRAAIVLSAGLGVARAADGRSLQQAMLDAARPHLLRILGPNCLGLLVPGVKLNASFAHTQALPGRLAFVSQSGALATAMLDWANSRGIGFSHFISLGDSADVDIGDVIDYLAADGQTSAVLMYLESVRAARKFMSAARAASRNKPVVVVKAGRAPEGAKAAASHTGALAGADTVYDAAFRRAGMVRVDTLDDLFDAAETVAHVRPLHGERLAIVTNGGGAGVLAADALSLQSGRLAPLSDATCAALDAQLPATWSRGNPVDLIGDAPIERYTAALQILLAAPEVDAVLLMHAPTAVVPSLQIAQACVPLLRAAAKPVLTSWLGAAVVADAARACEAAGVPTYSSPERAVTAFVRRVVYRQNQQALLQAPRASVLPFEPDRARARAVIDGALARERSLLDEVEAKALLDAYRIPIVPTRVARDADEAASMAAAIGYPVVLKLLSPQVSHKSDVGGVALALADEAALRRAAAEIAERLRTLRPDAQLAGYTVQAMVRRPRAHELIAGVASDAVFGPVLMFGQGGTAVELLNDSATALPPLNDRLAHDLIARTRVARLLAGYRDRASADVEAVAAVLLAVSQMVCDLPELIELDINPLLADHDGVIALDARVKLAATSARATDRLAIVPYPSQLEGTLQLDNTQLLLRPIRPEDAPRLRAFYAHASPADMRLRFFLMRREVPHSELARFSQIDYDREMAFIALPAGDAATPGDAETPMAGEVRASCDPDNQRAEFAIQIAGAWQRRGLGRALLLRLIEYLRERGTREVWGECLVENAGMAALARSVGFAVTAAAEPGVLELHLALHGNAPD